MHPLLRAFMAEPRPSPTGQVARADAWLAGVLVPAVVLEACLRGHLELRALHAVAGIALVLPLVVRRPHPFRAFVVSYGLAALVPLAALLFGIGWTDLHASAAILLLPYSLFRWGSGKEAVAGLGGIVALYTLTFAVGRFPGLEGAVGGAVVMLFPALVGVAVRFRASAQLREVEAARSNERARIARELHDSVAHHLSAIALQAQAGMCVAETRPEEGVAVLHVIEEAAAHALGELRTMVGALRDEGGASFEPQPGIDAIRALSTNGKDPLRVVVEVQGDGALAPAPVQAAVYRIAQEGITNARRHAKRAATVAVQVRARGGSIDVTITDDGERTSLVPTDAGGFGLVGMAERAALLGGTFHAGPLPERGFRVEATFPLRGEK